MKCSFLGHLLVAARCHIKAWQAVPERLTPGICIMLLQGLGPLVLRSRQLAACLVSPLGPSRATPAGLSRSSSPLAPLHLHVEKLCLDIVASKLAGMPRQGMHLQHCIVPDPISQIKQ